MRYACFVSSGEPVLIAVAHVHILKAPALRNALNFGEHRTSLLIKPSFLFVFFKFTKITSKSRLKNFIVEPVEFQLEPALLLGLGEN